jgi:Domain of unknown function (DUF4224)
MQSAELSPAEVAIATGKTRPASQAAVLAKRGVPFTYLGNAVRVARAVAQAFELLPKGRQGAGVDFSRVR